MELEKILLEEREIVGAGILTYQDETLGTCEYRLEMRKSLITTRVPSSEGKSLEQEQVIVTLMGTLAMLDAGEVRLASLCRMNNRHPICLHLHDDFFVLMNILALEHESNRYRVFGRIVSKASPMALPFL